ncbi:glycosyltransferase [Heliophilum fasciatum]|uniref:GT2 family glycosyltransferase n=1 Tax=Heliophilum fasciatum TaxID=35700 RepID=A0A4R2RZX3_9FIRM|nr:glycosyltransferase [Heliophilum fasciatum]MCW2276850.1 glycosyltransferase involved in cell wall biosynthesis [Heliophilum fasciatum]TCP68689.1 GT2 family glycosyltransferase [Heliophilum fasciatum]
MVLVLTVIIVLLVIQWLFVFWNMSYLLPLSSSIEPSQGSSIAPPTSQGPVSVGAVGSGDKISLSQVSATHTALAAPSLSILIPAREEEGNIGECLRALLADPDPSLEVIVLDDHSRDQTAAIVAAIANEGPRVRLIASSPLPPGWLGKSYGCHQLAQQAQGTWWLFLDADVRLQPDAIQQIKAAVHNLDRGLFSGIPFQETGSWLEKLVVPMMAFLIACHLPLHLVRTSPDPKFTAAHGAFLLIHRDTYKACGGHQAFRGHLLDDMQMARAVKKAGHPLFFRAIHHWVHMRMYHNAREVWNGFKKNLYPGLDRNPLILGGMLSLYSLLYLLPPLVLAASWLQPSWFLPSLTAYLLGVAIKITVDRCNGQPSWLGLFLPASILFTILIALASWRVTVTGHGYRWKGRTYE